MGLHLHNLSRIRVSGIRVSMFAHTPIIQGTMPCLKFMILLQLFVYVLFCFLKNEEGEEEGRSTDFSLSWPPGDYLNLLTLPARTPTRLCSTRSC